MQTRSISHYLLLFLSLTFFSADCGRFEDDMVESYGNVQLNFKGVFGADPLVMLADTYEYEEGMKVRFQLFQFYLSNIILLAKDGTKISLSPVTLVNFEQIQSGDAATKGLDFSFENVPALEYTGIEMGVGVAPLLNEFQPADFKVGHPLAIASNYWSGLSSYIFTKIEGNADLNGDGNFTEKLTFHIGEKEGVPMYEDIHFDADFRIDTDQTLTLPFQVDLKQVISPSANSFLDFRTVSQDHTNQASVYSFIIENLKKNAISLKL